MGVVDEQHEDEVGRRFHLGDLRRSAEERSSCGCPARPVREV